MIKNLIFTMWGNFSGSVTFTSISLIFKYWSTECKVPWILEYKQYLFLNKWIKIKRLFTWDHFLIQQLHLYQPMIWKMNKIAIKDELFK